jgi:hypothetical protein
VLGVFVGKRHDKLPPIRIDASVRNNPKSLRVGSSRKLAGIPIRWELCILVLEIKQEEE